MAGLVRQSGNKFCLECGHFNFRTEGLSAGGAFPKEQVDTFSPEPGMPTVVGPGAPGIVSGLVETLPGFPYG